MFKELLGKFRRQKSTTPDSVNVDEPIIEEPEFEISLSPLDNNIFKMEISDYVTMTNFFERMELIDYLGINPLVSNSVLWNSEKQRVNKGTYFVIERGYYLYDILINESVLKIDERIKIDDITEERVIRYEINSADYGFTMYKHDKTGSTFYVMIYSKNGPGFGKLTFSEEQAFQEISSIISNLENVEGVESIIDLNLLKKQILNDLNMTRQRKKD